MNFSDIKFPSITPESVEENLALIPSVPINGRLLHKFVPAGNNGIAIGDNVFPQVTSVSDQIAIGYNIFQKLQGNNYATIGIGGSIGMNMLSSNESVYVGHYQVSSVKSSSYTVAVGLYNGVYLNPDGSNWGNTMVGYDAGEGAGSQVRNVYIGMNCGSGNWHQSYINNDCILIGSYNELWNSSGSVSNSMLFGNYMYNFEAENNTIYMGKADQTFVLQKGAVIGELTTANLGTDKLRVVGNTTVTGHLKIGSATSGDNGLSVTRAGNGSWATFTTDNNGFTEVSIQNTSTGGSAGAAVRWYNNGGLQLQQFLGSTSSAWGGNSPFVHHQIAGNYNVVMTNGFKFFVSSGIGSGSFLEVGSAGTKILNALNLGSVPEHADNTAAKAANLVNGDVYRTGDVLKIVHA